MESESLAVGQRTGEMILNSAWTEEEVKLLAEHGLTVEEMAEHFVLSRGVDTLNAAIGTVLDEKRLGTKRSRPIQTEAEVNAEVHEGALGLTPEDKPAHVSELVPDLNSSSEVKE